MPCYISHSTSILFCLVSMKLCYFIFTVAMVAEFNFSVILDSSVAPVATSDNHIILLDKGRITSLYKSWIVLAEQYSYFLKAVRIILSEEW